MILSIIFCSIVCSNCSSDDNVWVRIKSFGDSTSDDDWERTTVDRVLLDAGDGICFDGSSFIIVVVIDGINTESGLIVILVDVEHSSWENICVQRINESRLTVLSTRFNLIINTEEKFYYLNSNKK